MALLPVSRKNSSDLSKLHRDMDDLFGSFFGGWPSMFSDKGLWPAIDVAESENEITLNAEVPGCKAEDIDISMQGNTLVISGEKKQKQEEKEKGYYHVERSYGSFRREFSLPSEIDASKIDASYKDGILTVKVPKSEKAKPLKIKVKEQ